MKILKKKKSNPVFCKNKKNKELQNIYNKKPDVYGHNLIPTLQRPTNCVKYEVKKTKLTPRQP